MLFSSNPAGRLVRQPPIGVGRRRTLLSWGSPAAETPASVESSHEPRGRPDRSFSSGAQGPRGWRPVAGRSLIDGSSDSARTHPSRTSKDSLIG